MKGQPALGRRTFLLASLSGLACSGRAWAQTDAQSARVTQPFVSEQACPLHLIEPTAADGHRGLGVLRQPPGQGPFPAIINVHGGITTVPLARLQTTARDMATPSRFLAAGYVVVAATYRSRDVDIESQEPIADVLAMVDHVRRLPQVDGESLILHGCSGGGDLALEVAARTHLRVVVAEEPASVVMSGIFNNSTPKAGARFTPEDGMFLLTEARAHYTPERQRALRAKLARIDCPILIVQGDEDRRELPINRFNADLLIPELRATGRAVTVNTYPGQAHCFCIASGLPRPGGQPAPASWPAAALKAFRDIDAFCRRYVRMQPRAIEPRLLSHRVVREGPIAQ